MAELRSKGVIAAIVLIALLIIFVPLFFMEARSEPKLLTIPNLPFTPSPDQFSPGLNNTDQRPQNPFTLPLSPAKAWVLQVADFKESGTANAHALIQTLREKGFKAYTRQIMLPTGRITRVFVGPEMRSDTLKMLETQLTKEMSLKSTVTSFDPLLL
ncbi:MAG: SPOR domain-containing protein [Pseudomonadota bacterium]